MSGWYPDGIVLASLLFMKRMADAGKYSLAEVDEEEDVIENYSGIPKHCVEKL